MLVNKYSFDQISPNLCTAIYLIGTMLKKPETVEPALDLILISRHVERIADHAASIAEEVIFMVSGRDIRHQRKESFTVS